MRGTSLLQLLQARQGRGGGVGGGAWLDEAIAVVADGISPAETVLLALLRYLLKTEFLHRDCVSQHHAAGLIKTPQQLIMN